MSASAEVESGIPVGQDVTKENSSTAAECLESVEINQSIDIDKSINLETDESKAGSGSDTEAHPDDPKPPALPIRGLRFDQVINRITSILRRSPAPQSVTPSPPSPKTEEHQDDEQKMSQEGHEETTVEDLPTPDTTSKASKRGASLDSSQILLDVPGPKDPPSRQLSKAASVESIHPPSKSKFASFGMAFTQLVKRVLHRPSQSAATDEEAGPPSELEDADVRPDSEDEAELEQGSSVLVRVRQDKLTDLFKFLSEATDNRPAVDRPTKSSRVKTKTPPPEKKPTGTPKKPSSGRVAVKSSSGANLGAPDAAATPAADDTSKPTPLPASITPSSSEHLQAEQLEIKSPDESVPNGEEMPKVNGHADEEHLVNGDENLTDRSDLTQPISAMEIFEAIKTQEELAMGSEDVNYGVPEDGHDVMDPAEMMSPPPEQPAELVQKVVETAEELTVLSSAPLTNDLDTTTHDAINDHDRGGEDQLISDTLASAVEEKVAHFGEIEAETDLHEEEAVNIATESYPVAEEVAAEEVSEVHESLETAPGSVEEDRLDEEKRAPSMIAPAVAAIMEDGMSDAVSMKVEYDTSEEIEEAVASVNEAIDEAVNVVDDSNVTDTIEDEEKAFNESYSKQEAEQLPEVYQPATEENISDPSLMVGTEAVSGASLPATPPGSTDIPIDEALSEGDMTEKLTEKLHEFSEELAVEQPAEAALASPRETSTQIESIEPVSGALGDNSGEQVGLPEAVEAVEQELSHLAVGGGDHDAIPEDLKSNVTEEIYIEEVRSPQPHAEAESEPADPIYVPAEPGQSQPEVEARADEQTERFAGMMSSEFVDEATREAAGGHEDAATEDVIPDYIPQDQAVIDETGAFDQTSDAVPEEVKEAAEAVTTVLHEADAVRQPDEEIFKDEEPAMVEIVEDAMKAEGMDDPLDVSDRPVSPVPLTQDTPEPLKEPTPEVTEEIIMAEEVNEMQQVASAHDEAAEIMQKMASDDLNAEIDVKEHLESQPESESLPTEVNKDQILREDPDISESLAEKVDELNKLGSLEPTGASPLPSAPAPWETSEQGPGDPYVSESNVVESTAAPETDLSQAQEAHQEPIPDNLDAEEQEEIAEKVEDIQEMMEHIEHSVGDQPPEVIADQVEKLQEMVADLQETVDEALEPDELQGGEQNINFAPSQAEPEGNTESFGFENINNEVAHELQQDFSEAAPAPVGPLSVEVSHGEERISVGAYPMSEQSPREMQVEDIPQSSPGFQGDVSEQVTDGVAVIDAVHETAEEVVNQQQEDVHDQSKSPEVPRDAKIDSDEGIAVTEIIEEAYEKVDSKYNNESMGGNDERNDEPMIQAISPLTLESTEYTPNDSENSTYRSDEPQYENKIATGLLQQPLSEVQVESVRSESDDVHNEVALDIHAASTVVESVADTLEKTDDAVQHELPADSDRTDDPAESYDTTQPPEIPYDEVPIMGGAVQDVLTTQDTQDAQIAQERFDETEQEIPSVEITEPQSAAPTYDEQGRVSEPVVDMSSAPEVSSSPIGIETVQNEFEEVKDRVEEKLEDFGDTLEDAAQCVQNKFEPAHDPMTSSQHFEHGITDDDHSNVLTDIDNKAQEMAADEVYTENVAEELNTAPTHTEDNIQDKLKSALEDVKENLNELVEDARDEAQAFSEGMHTDNADHFSEGLNVAPTNLEESMQDKLESAVEDVTENLSELVEDARDEAQQFSEGVHTDSQAPAELSPSLPEEDSRTDNSENIEQGDETNDEGQSMTEKLGSAVEAVKENLAETVEDVTDAAQGLIGYITGDGEEDKKDDAEDEKKKDAEDDERKQEEDQNQESDQAETGMVEKLQEAIVDAGEMAAIPSFIPVSESLPAAESSDFEEQESGKKVEVEVEGEIVEENIQQGYGAAPSSDESYPVGPFQTLADQQSEHPVALEQSHTDVPPDEDADFGRGFVPVLEAASPVMTADPVAEPSEQVSESVADKLDDIREDLQEALTHANESQPESVSESVTENIQDKLQGSLSHLIDSKDEPAAESVVEKLEEFQDELQESLSDVIDSKDEPAGESVVEKLDDIQDELQESLSHVMSSKDEPASESVVEKLEDIRDDLNEALDDVSKADDEKKDTKVEEDPQQISEIIAEHVQHQNIDAVNTGYDDSIGDNDIIIDHLPAEENGPEKFDAGDFADTSALAVVDSTPRSDSLQADENHLLSAMQEQASPNTTDHIQDQPVHDSGTDIIESIGEKLDEHLAGIDKVQEVIAQETENYQPDAPSNEVEQPVMMAVSESSYAEAPAGLGRVEQDPEHEQPWTGETDSSIHNVCDENVLEEDHMHDKPSDHSAESAVPAVIGGSMEMQLDEPATEVPLPDVSESGADIVSAIASPGSNVTASYEQYKSHTHEVADHDTVAAPVYEGDVSAFPPSESFAAPNQKPDMEPEPVISADAAEVESSINESAHYVPQEIASDLPAAASSDHSFPAQAEEALAATVATELPHERPAGDGEEEYLQAAHSDVVSAAPVGEEESDKPLPGDDPAERVIYDIDEHEEIAQSVHAGNLASSPLDQPESNTTRDQDVPGVAEVGGTGFIGNVPEEEVEGALAIAAAELRDKAYEERYSREPSPNRPLSREEEAIVEAGGWVTEAAGVASAVSSAGIDERLGSVGPPEAVVESLSEASIHAAAQEPPFDSSDIERAYAQPPQAVEVPESDSEILIGSEETGGRDVQQPLSLHSPDGSFSSAGGNNQALSPPGAGDNRSLESPDDIPMISASAQGSPQMEKAPGGFPVPSNNGQPPAGTTTDSTMTSGSNAVNNNFLDDVNGNIDVASAQLDIHPQSESTKDIESSSTNNFNTVP